MLSFLGIAFTAVRNNRVVQIVMAILGFLLFLKFLDHRAYRRGARETKDYIEKRSTEAALKREEERREVDRDASRPGSAERLQSRWSRD